MFYDKFLTLCIKKNMSPSAAAIDAGFSNAAAAGWKKGATPRGSAVKKLADYFGVPVSYFSEEDQETEKSPALQPGIFLCLPPEPRTLQLFRPDGKISPYRLRDDRRCYQNHLRFDIQQDTTNIPIFVSSCLMAAERFPFSMTGSRDMNKELSKKRNRHTRTPLAYGNLFKTM